jgi:HD domain-containing protein
VELKGKNGKLTFEITLLLITLGMTSLLVMMREHKIVILYLYFLPVVLSGYFLGRVHAGVLALFSAMSVTIALTLESSQFAVYSSPAMIGLVVTIWAAVLGLTALMIGTLCDERAVKVVELHTAYVGVVEVLARYLQSANPHVKARSIRVAEISQKVAEALGLTQKEIDDIRVGALLYDIGNVEITTQLITKAVGSIESESVHGKHTFQGRELVHSLEPVLSGAVPLLLNLDDAVHDVLAVESGNDSRDIPLGATIIRAVRAYESLVDDNRHGRPMSAEEAVTALRKDPYAKYETRVLDALERCQVGHRSLTPYEESICAS